MVLVYWRPACGFCIRLLQALSNEGVEVELHNIWEDPAAAAFVRSVAGGNETVPTVVVDGQVHVNPPPDMVITAARAA